MMSSLNSELHFNNIDDFIQLSDEEIKRYVREQAIQTIYLPIDGTRRYFINKTDIDYSDPSFFNEYFEFSSSKMIEILEKVFSLGLKYVIVLLMDHTAFNRDRDYLKNAIELGIKPLTNHKKFLNFYDTHDINLTFGGFNNEYNKRGFQDVTVEFKRINRNSKPDADKNLIFYTGPSHEMEIANVMQKVGMDYNGHTLKERVYDKLYPIDIPPVDFSVFFGYPRDKVTPILLTGNGVNFYTQNPSLSTSKVQLKKAIYLTSMTQGSIKDRYLKYKNGNGSMELDNFNNSNLLGENWYYQNDG